MYFYKQEVEYTDNSSLSFLHKLLFRRNLQGHFIQTKQKVSKYKQNSYRIRQHNAKAHNIVHRVVLIVLDFIQSTGKIYPYCLYFLTVPSLSTIATFLFPLDPNFLNCYITISFHCSTDNTPSLSRCFKGWLPSSFRKTYCLLSSLLRNK